MLPYQREILDIALNGVGLVLIAIAIFCLAISVRKQK